MDIGAIVTCAIYICCMLTFVFRLLGKPEVGRRFGYLLFLMALPLGYLLAVAPGLERPALYYLQIALMLAFMLVELLLDFVLKVDFRHTKWMVIAYVVLFFAGTGGMLGVAGYAGIAWTAIASVLFLAMAALAFVQRAVTGA